MFDDFVLERIDVGEAVLRVRHGGSGSPLLLLLRPLLVLEYRPPTSSTGFFRWV